MMGASRCVVGLLAGVVLAASAAAQQATPEYRVWSVEVVVAPPPVDDPLCRRLHREIEELLDAADPEVDGGLLRPGWFDPGLGGPSLLFGAPLETVHVLLDAAPLLVPALRQRVLARTRTVVSARPLCETAFVHGPSGWGSHPLDGPRREFHRLPEGLQVNVWPAPEVPVETLFVAWEFAAVHGDLEWLRARRSDLLRLQAMLEGAGTRAGELAAALGAARAAALLEDESLREAAERRALDSMASADVEVWVTTASARFTRGAHDFTLPLFHFLRGKVAVGALYVREVGAFLAEERGGALRARLDPLLGGPGAAHARARLPAWFVHRGDYPFGEYLYRDDPRHAQAGWQGGENSFVTPDLAWTLYHLHAIAYRPGVEELRARVGTPSCIGDLYWIQRAVTALRAGLESRWVDLRDDPRALQLAD